MSPPIRTPDGSEVSEIVLPDGSTASQVIGPDGNVVFEAGGDIPDGTVDNFEPTLYEDQGNTLSSYYTGDLSNFNRQTNTVLDGEQTLASDGTAGVDLISNSGLPNYPQQNTTLRYLIRADGSGPRFSVSLFADGIGANKGAVDNGYMVQMNVESGWELIERSGGSTKKNTGVSGTASTSTTYVVDALYDASTFDVIIERQSDGTEVFSDSITPNNDFSAQDGVHYGDLDGGASVYVDTVQNV